MEDRRNNPIRRSKNSKGPFYQWGNKTKYYYTAGDEKSRLRAYDKAKKQAAAIFSSGYRPKANPRKNAMRKIRAITSGGPARN